MVPLGFKQQVFSVAAVFFLGNVFQVAVSAQSSGRLLSWSVKCNSCFGADLSPDGGYLSIETLAASKDASQPGHVWLQVMGYRGHRIISSRPLPVDAAYMSRVLAYRPPWESFVRFSPAGRFLLAYREDVGKLFLFRLQESDLVLVHTIDMGLAADRPTLALVGLEWSFTGMRAAALFSWDPFHEGIVRLYNLETGEIVWQRSFNGVDMGHVAWNPDGRSLAITLVSGEPHSLEYPPRQLNNLLILDAASGRTLMSINTGDLAGPVCFARSGEVGTAPFHFYPIGRGPLHHEKAKIWDSKTGRLEREISSPGRDIHNDLELSFDGKILLAFVGKEKSGISLRALENVNEVIDRRFQLFDFRTGKVITTSPDLGYKLEGYRGHVGQPCFRLSAKGNRILAYWPDSLHCPVMFELLRVRP